MLTINNITISFFDFFYLRSEFKGTNLCLKGSFNNRNQRKF